MSYVVHNNWFACSFDEHSPFYITYGTNECLKLPGNSTFRKVVFERNTTVLIHPKYIQGQESYDVALIHLSDPIDDLPSYDEDYTGGLVNSVCFHTNQNYNKSEGDKVYVAGFGSKGLGRNDDSNLTWTYGRVVDSGMDPIYQSLFLGEFYRQQRTEVLDYYKFEKWHTTCGGDSGSSYLWYIDTGDQEVTNVSKYRAVTVSIVNAAIESCEFRYFHDVTTLGVGADMAVKVYHPQVYEWINKTVSMREGLAIFPAPEQDPGTNNWPRPGFHI
ncbi:hypothetical protein HDE_07815 [Halotydeus destructor]|nr:hypothetical protein HDE_07815 [Halotydeus destructor]